MDELLSKDQDSWKDNDRSDVSDEEEWNGIGVEENVPVDHEDIYEEEDRNTTVVVEEVDITRHGFEKVRGPEYDEAEGILHAALEQPRKTNRRDETPLKKRKWSAIAPKRDKQKKKNFRYETKAERKMTRSKERTGNAKARAKRKDKT